MDQGNHFTAATAINPEIRNVGCDDGILGMKLAQPDRHRSSQIGFAVLVADGQFFQPRKVIRDPSVKALTKCVHGLSRALRPPL